MINRLFVHSSEKLYQAHYIKKPMTQPAIAALGLSVKGYITHMASFDSMKGYLSIESCCRFMRRPHVSCR